MDFQSNTVIVRGLRLHYLRQGKGRPILLLHGWPTNSFIWRNLMPGLSRVGSVYALDLPGFGASDKPLEAEYTFTWFSLFVEGFVDSLGLDEVTLVGHDIGAPSGVLWASRRPKQVRALALLSAPIFPWRTTSDKVSQMLLRTPMLRSWLVGPRGLALMLRANVANKSAMPQHVVSQYRAPYQTREGRRLLLQTIRSPLASPNAGELRDLFEKISCISKPIALVYGDRDKLCGDHMRELSRRLPHATVFRFGHCGHYIQEDCPKELEEVLVQFLTGLPS